MKEKRIRERYEMERRNTCSDISLRMASDVLPLATISKYLPRRMKEMSMADVSKNVMVISCSSPMEPCISGE